MPRNLSRIATNLWHRQTKIDVIPACYCRFEWLSLGVYAVPEKCDAVHSLERAPPHRNGLKQAYVTPLKAAPSAVLRTHGRCDLGDGRGVANFHPIDKFF